MRPVASTCRNCSIAQGCKQFARAIIAALTEWLTPLAMQTTQGMVLAQALAEELRVRHVLLPPIPVIEHLCATALTRAERATFERLTKPLTAAHRARPRFACSTFARVGPRCSTLAWLRQAPATPAPMPCSRIWPGCVQCESWRCRRSSAATCTRIDCCDSHARGSPDRGLSDPGI
jgi:hypothetical protein